MNPELHEIHRAATIDCRSGAIFNAFVELDGIINKSALARQYFDRSQSWLSQRLNGSTVNNTATEFTATEARQLADALRDIARRLGALADEIADVADVD